MRLGRLGMPGMMQDMIPAARHMLAHMAPTAQLIAIETNPAFRRILRSEISDARLCVVGDSAFNLSRILDAAGLRCADCRGSSGTNTS